MSNLPRVEQVRVDGKDRFSWIEYDVFLPGEEKPKHFGYFSEVCHYLRSLDPVPRHYLSVLKKSEDNPFEIVQTVLLGPKRA